MVSVESSLLSLTVGVWLVFFLFMLESVMVFWYRIPYRQEEEEDVAEPEHIPQKHHFHFNIYLTPTGVTKVEQAPTPDDDDDKDSGSSADKEDQFKKEWGNIMRDIQNKADDDAKKNEEELYQKFKEYMNKTLQDEWSGPQDSW